MRIISFIVFIALGGMPMQATEIKAFEGRVTTSHGSVWYKKVYTEATAAAVPLLVVHGGPGFTHDYLAVLKEHAVDRPVIFYDQLGAGKSALQAGDVAPTSLDYFVEELGCVIEALGYDAVHLYAHSWGAAIAARYLLRDQSCVSRVVLASPLLSTARWTDDCNRLLTAISPEAMANLTRAEAAADFDNQAYRDALQSFYTRHVCRLAVWPQDLLTSVAAVNVALKNRIWGLLAFTITGTLRDFDGVRELSALALPTLVTCGRFDQATPETMAQVVKELPDGRLMVFEQSSHSAFFEEPSAYHQAIANFLAEQ